MISKALTITCAFLICGSAYAQTAVEDMAAARRYQTCLLMVEDDPDKAYDVALDWRDTGGGMPAKHCAALALVGLKLYPEAAQQLEELAYGQGQADTELRAQILAQAGNAYALANRADKAIDAFDDAVALLGDNRAWAALIRLDRARLLTLLEEWQLAQQDLDAVILNDDLSGLIIADALAMRADLLRQQNEPDLAMEDATTALEMVKDHRGALLVRGRIYAARGHKQAARADFRTILTANDTDEISEAARTVLQVLEQ